MSQTYQYRALEKLTDIRILHLGPGRESDSLRCRIEHVDVNLGNAFSAISYVWGSEEKPHQMLIEDNQYLLLTTSLCDAIQNLQPIADFQQKTFWADQICINQSDIEERNRPVAMMGTIYRKASQFITYIGPEHPGDREGIKLIEKVFYET
jgi:hypothetical protein